MQQLPHYLIPLSIALAPVLVIGAFAFACLFYRQKGAPVSWALYGFLLIIGAIGGYLFGLYYGGDWAFHSGQIDCGTSGLGCALFAIVFAGPLAAAFTILCIAVFLGRK